MIRARCEVLSVRRAGVYHSLTLVAPEIADAVSIAVREAPHVDLVDDGATPPGWAVVSDGA